ncbi:MAG: BrxA/BrxB family bacilliredoxin [Bacilli bacterium]
MNAYEEYMQQIIGPMRAELSTQGFTELLTEEDVENWMANQKGRALVVVNSVCGCAAGIARPSAVAASRASETQPLQLATVFAGQDREATNRLRAYFPEVAPSSPSFFILHDGELVGHVAREQVEGHDPNQVVHSIVTHLEA